MDKLGQFEITRKHFYFMFVAVYITVIFFFYLAFIRSYAANVALIQPDVQESIYIHRFLNSPDCFAYTDERSSRTFSGVVDLGKFRQENIDSCFKSNERTFNFRINLKYIDEGKETANTVESSYFRFGKGLHTEIRDVVVYGNGKLINGKMEFLVQPI